MSIRDSIIKFGVARIFAIAGWGSLGAVFIALAVLSGTPAAEYLSDWVDWYCTNPQEVRLKLREEVAADREARVLGSRTS